MDYHWILNVVGGVLVLLLFLPLLSGALKNKGAGQSFAMWLLWAALDGILTVSLIEQRGNFLLPLGFAIGDACLAGLLLFQGRGVWGRFETVISVLVGGCLVAWKIGGPLTATVASTLGIVIAGVPGLVELWRNPQVKVGYIWGGYVLANLISFFGGRSMTVEERFAPAIFAAYSLLMVLVSRRPPA